MSLRKLYHACEPHAKIVEISKNQRIVSSRSVVRSIKKKGTCLGHSDNKLLVVDLSFLTSRRFSLILSPIYSDALSKSVDKLLL